MPLDLPGLINDLNVLKVNFPATTQNASNAWAQAYTKYANTATAAGSIPATIEPTTLAELFNASMLAATFLTDMAKNLTSFWLTPPVLFVGVNNGSVTGVAGAAALIAEMTRISLGAVAGTITDPLIEIANAMDVFTKTVLVALVSPTGAPIPTLLL